MEALFATLAFVIPAVVLMLMARRFVAVARNLRDPEALEKRLRLEVDRVLVQAGVDPETISDEDPEALKRVGAEASRDVHKAILRTLFEVEERTASGEVPDGSRTVHIGEYTVGNSPVPIDQGSRSRSSLMLAGVVICFVIGVALLIR